MIYSEIHLIIAMSISLVAGAYIHWCFTRKKGIFNLSAHDQNSSNCKQSAHGGF